MKLFRCTNCGNRVFFENVRCEACGMSLGYALQEAVMTAFAPDADGVIVRIGDSGTAYRACANYAEGVCNWLVPADGDERYCGSCRTTHTIPALSKPENRLYWQLLEQEKRGLFYSLHQLGLATPNKADDPAGGLSFEFLEEVDPKQRVLTGHDEGVITLNIAEADDAQREQIRLAMREPYRTLIGHFRHEVGHYYWDRLIRETNWIDEFRSLFGDERTDYQKALEHHYAQPPADWQSKFISSYASSHPWEDWAECWAHYLHVIDGMETAAAWGLVLRCARPAEPAEVEAFGVTRESESIEAAFVQQWLPIAQFVNAMDRSLGFRGSYPFVVVPDVVEKLNFIHRVVRSTRVARPSTPPVQPTKSKEASVAQTALADRSQ